MASNVGFVAPEQHSGRSRKRRPTHSGRIVPRTARWYLSFISHHHAFWAASAVFLFLPGFPALVIASNFTSVPISFLSNITILHKACRRNNAATRKTPTLVSRIEQLFRLLNTDPRWPRSNSRRSISVSSCDRLTGDLGGAGLAQLIYRHRTRAEINGMPRIRKLNNSAMVKSCQYNLLCFRRCDRGTIGTVGARGT
jgi:hypothetical protein